MNPKQTSLSCVIFIDIILLYDFTKIKFEKVQLVNLVMYLDIFSFLRISVKTKKLIIGVVNVVGLLINVYLCSQKLT